MHRTTMLTPMRPDLEDANRRTDCTTSGCCEEVRRHDGGENIVDKDDANKAGRMISPGDDNDSGGENQEGHKTYDMLDTRRTILMPRITTESGRHARS